MNIPRWTLPASLTTLALAIVGTVWIVRRTPGASLAGILGAVVITSGGMLAAGATHHFAHRLIARRPWGTYLSGILIGESYLFTIMGALTVAKLVGAPGLVRPDQSSDPFGDWPHWPIVVASGVVGGLLWGFLSRNDLVIKPGD